MKHTNKFTFRGLIIFASVLLSSNFCSGQTFYFGDVWGQKEKEAGFARSDDFLFFTSTKSLEGVKVKTGKNSIATDAQYISLNSVGGCIIRNFKSPNVNVPIIYNSDGDNLYLRVGGFYLRNIIAGCESNTSYNAYEDVGGLYAARYGFYAFPSSKGSEGMWVSNITTSMKLKNRVAVTLIKQTARTPAFGVLASGVIVPFKHDYQ